jgi:hypothetical protein
LHYLALAFGEIAGSQLGGWFMDFSYKRLKAHRSNNADELEPEHRIPLLLSGIIMLLLALIVHG